MRNLFFPCIGNNSDVYVHVLIYGTICGTFSHVRIEIETYSVIAQRYLPAGRQGAVACDKLYLMEKMYYVYALLSEVDHRIYVGMSYHPEKRLIEHNAGEVTSTRPYRPWKMIYCKLVGKDRSAARQEEKRLKSGYGKEFLKKYIPE